ncbi:MAG: L,D-transpeptidase [Anaerolineaceae bacterium]|nr:L,D-transpeptidase [Anaerolineaceae bacterium]
MRSKRQKKAHFALNRARLALIKKDINGAFKYAKIAADLNPQLEEAWLILASVSGPKESIEFLNHALEINPESKKARKGMRWAVRRYREIQQKNVQNETSSPKKHVSEKNNIRKLIIQWEVSLFISIIFIGSVLMIWLIVPAIQAQASIQKEPRPQNALPKPTLTPTATPTPTLTPTPTPTMTPTATPKPIISYSYNYPHSWNIPEEVSGTDDFWVEVDLSTQMLYAYRGSQIINSYLVSTGISSHPTVTGTYKIYAKYPTYTMVGPGYNLPDVPYSMFFYKGYSIHGTYWHSNFGTPMSHGCVNMNTNDAAWIYSQSSIGTYVFVHY